MTPRLSKEGTIMFPGMLRVQKYCISPETVPVFCSSDAAHDRHVSLPSH